MDDSEGTNSHQSFEINGDNNNFSENEDERNTESDTKSAHSQTDCYSNASNSDVVIKTIADVISNEKNFIDFNVTHSSDGDIRKAIPLRTTCCKCTSQSCLASRLISSQSVPFYVLA